MTERRRPAWTPRITLRFGLPVLLFCGTAVLFALTSWYAHRMGIIDARRELSATAEGRGRSLEADLRFLLRKGELEQVQSIVAALATEPNTTLAFVIDDRRRVIASTVRAWLGRPLDSVLARGPTCCSARVADFIRKSAATKQHSTAAFDEEGTLVGVYLFAMPPRPGQIGNPGPGSIVLTYDLARAVALARAAIDRDSRLVATIALFSALALAVALHFTVSKRLWRIEQAVRRRATGDRSAISGIRGKDEIGQVGEAFDTMTVALDSSQADLAASQATLTMLVEHAPEAVTIYDAERSVLVEANQAAERLLGYRRAELLALPLSAVSPARQPDGQLFSEAVERWDDRVREGATEPFGWTCLSASGEEIPCEVRLLRLPSVNSKLIRASITDLRERKAAQEQLLRAQKLESVGRLAGGVAHDFNNLLSIVLTSTELAQRGIEPDSALGDKLAEIKAAAHRGAALTRQLLAFAGRQVVEPRAIDLNETTRALSRLLERLLGDDIALVTRLEESPWFVRADPGQFEQVVVNLAVNARDAMPSGGTVTIQTENITLEGATHGLESGDYVRLTVHDTGTGFDDSIKERLFEPFFTTKDQTKGTGLGLATCYGIATAAGGTITATSEVGRGAAFAVYLPRTLEIPAAVAPPMPTAAPESLGRKHRVLVVEDEKRLRPVVVLALEEEGHDVLAAADASEAIRLVEQGAAIDLLVTDVVLPGMGGGELASTLRSQFPALRVLYTSGYDQEQVERYGGTGPGTDFLQKPYSLTTLTDRVAQLLA